MDEAEIDVNWRAVIVPASGAAPIYGRMCKIGNGKVVVKADHNLPAGHQCSLAVMLPKRRADDTTQYIEGRGVVSISIQSSYQFRITLRSLEMKGNGKEILNEQIRRYKYK